MNGFRVTILVLLALALGLMFYVVTVVIPEEKANYAEYQEALRDSDYQRKDAEHRARLAEIHPAATESEADLARQEAERNAKAREQARIQREEQLVLEAGRQAEIKSREAQPQERSEADSPVALVAVYDKDNNLMMLKPVTEDGMLAVGHVLAIRRNGSILCEIVVDARDEESGQYSAYVKRPQSVSAEAQPLQGDEVIVSPLPQVSDLPALGTGVSSEPALGQDVTPASADAVSPAPANADRPVPALSPLPKEAPAPAPAPLPEKQQPDEVDIPLIPVRP